MTTEKHYFVQRRHDGRWEVIAEGAERASFIFDTQAEAEAKARELNPEGRPNVRRVRYTDRGRPGEFRKEDAG
jgi:hypothetical protein